MMGESLPDSDLTIFFIVEPPEYQNLACYLAASIRTQFGPAVRLVGYTPAHRAAEVSPEARTVLERLGCELRTFEAEGRFDPPYPHGNKLLAALEPRDTPWSAFMDSDIVCLRPNSAADLVKPGHVSVSKAASMIWAGQDIWTTIYAACGMPIPEERFRLMRQARGQPRIPYFSSGLVVFPERHRNAEGLSFPEVWNSVAATLDARPDIPRRRPYLDQMSLPLAIRKAGLDWNILPEEQHYILGGRSRGKRLPAGRDIRIVHYRNWQVLRETGLVRQTKQMLEDRVGARRISQAARLEPVGAGVTEVRPLP